MRIKKTSETTPVQAQIVDGYSTSTTDGYSANYINNNFETKSTILWTNPNPTDFFNSQTITLSSDNYDIYEVYYLHAGADTTLLHTKSIKGYGCIAVSILSNNSPFRRIINYTDATHLAVENSSGTSNNTLIPQYVIGYKTGLFN